jgi:hypothetical protein
MFVSCHQHYITEYSLLFFFAEIQDATMKNKFKQIVLFYTAPLDIFIVSAVEFLGTIFLYVYVWACHSKLYVFFSN